MVFYVSIFIVCSFTLWGIFRPDELTDISTYILDFTITKFGWFYLIIVTALLIMVLYLALSKYGKIVLGGEGEEPQFSYGAWVAMLFSAGMGLGLLFWGVAEPLKHFIFPPMELVLDKTKAAETSILYSFFHWGLHSWAIYCTTGLIIAYFTFTKGKDISISDTFIPLIKEKGANGYLGKIIDILAILATTFGIATSLGLGALQINGGMNSIIGLDMSPKNQAIIIVCGTVVLVLFFAFKVKNEIKILSNIAIILAIVLMLFVLIFGPTFSILEIFTNTIGDYIQRMPGMSLKLDPFGESKWIEKWTLFYWAWGIALSPFVGVFIAKISRGRTIKEFVLGVLFIPSLFNFLWFSVFGGTALNFQVLKNPNLAEEAISEISTALFVTLGEMPFTNMVSILTIVAIAIFFISSADSSTVVLSMLSFKGKKELNVYVKITWCICQALITITLLFSAGIKAVTTLAIIVALPFSFILVFMCISFFKELKKENRL